MLNLKVCLCAVGDRSSLSSIADRLSPPLRRAHAWSLVGTQRHHQSLFAESSFDCRPHQLAALPCGLPFSEQRPDLVLGRRIADGCTAGWHSITAEENNSVEVPLHVSRELGLGERPHRVRRRPVDLALRKHAATCRVVRQSLFDAELSGLLLRELLPAKFVRGEEEDLNLVSECGVQVQGQLVASGRRASP